jgi:hypothetical protein
VDLRLTSQRPWHDGRRIAARTLRARWRQASLACGWPFPRDWAVPEVDTVCRDAVLGDELVPAVRALGRVRAEGGAGLAETLSDVAALHAVLENPGEVGGIVAADPDAVPGWLLRASALGWADVMLAQLARGEVTDALTGLVTVSYLQTRLHEVYRECSVQGTAPGQQYALIGIRLDTGSAAGWSGVAAKVLLADVLRCVFDGGETICAVNTRTALVLTHRDERIAMRLASVRLLAEQRLHTDSQLRGVSRPAIWLRHLPAGYDAACALLDELVGLGDC